MCRSVRQMQQPSWVIEEEHVYSFRWSIPEYVQLRESVKSTDYRCVNGNRWRGLLSFTADQPNLSLQLVSAVIPIMVGVK